MQHGCDEVGAACTRRIRGHHVLADVRRSTRASTSLNGVNFVTYDGWALVFGKDPTVASLPAACAVNTGPVTRADAAQANVGPQLLAILGLVCAGLAMVTGLSRSSVSPGGGAARWSR